MIPIPTNIPWRAVGAALLAAGLFAAGWTANGWRKGAEIDRMSADLARERQGQAMAQVKAVDDARIEEQRRTAAQTEIANVATKDAESARADARASDAVAGRLRVQLAAYVAASRAAGNPTAASASPAAGDPLDVLADVLSRADQSAGILAEYADAAHIAGLACERSYDALTNRAAK